MTSVYKNSPTMSQVHVDAPLGSDNKSRRGKLKDLSLSISYITPKSKNKYKPTELKKMAYEKQLGHEVSSTQYNLYLSNTASKS